MPRFFPMLRWFVFRSALGFTQIELMVAILVAGILAAIAAPNLAPWLRQQQVNAALNQIDQAIQETQSEALKRNRGCSISLTRGTEVTLTGTCLVTGPRTLKGVRLDHSRSNATWVISFNAAGENRSPGNDPGTLWLSAPSVQSKCLVISVGIGLRRTGQYRNNVCITP
ncbi:Tfp pilus assembly protein FimT/FimU [Altericista sp. CCNU0014]|uniref:pilus assembly FimT family protein n=1 Tax=Altericista sp. CCNU0014 TaxID=3082949 RepID=UPI00384A860C